VRVTEYNLKAKGIAMESTERVDILHDRVAEHTAPEVNSRLLRGVEQSLVYYAERPEQINQRLEELRREWDIERVLESNASAFALLGLLIATVGRRPVALLLPLVVAGFLLQHAIQGWCPPVVLFRRLGVRTMEEIMLEYNALRALRGDLEAVSVSHDGSPQERVRRIVTALNA
jgi:sirohydrochlorin ferrochelatase